MPLLNTRIEKKNPLGPRAAPVLDIRVQKIRFITSKLYTIQDSLDDVVIIAYRRNKEVGSYNMKVLSSAVDADTIYLMEKAKQAYLKD